MVLGDMLSKFWRRRLRALTRKPRLDFHQAISLSGWLLVLFGIVFVLLMISLAGLVALFLSLGLARAIAFWPFVVMLALLVLGSSGSAF